MTIKEKYGVDNHEYWCRKEICLIEFKLKLLYENMINLTNKIQDEHVKVSEPLWNKLTDDLYEINASINKKNEKLQELNKELIKIIRDLKDKNDS